MFGEGTSGSIAKGCRLKVGCWGKKEGIGTYFGKAVEAGSWEVWAGSFGDSAEGENSEGFAEFGNSAHSGNIEN